MKECGKCHVPKDDEGFPWKNGRHLERSVVCKECQKQYKLDHYYKNKQQYFDRNATSKKKLQDFANSKKTKCAICPESEKVCLDFHHLRDKADDVSRLIGKGSLKGLVKEIEKCVVLCANCHRKVHAGLIEIPVMCKG